jgi:LysM repeat protein
MTDARSRTTLIARAPHLLLAALSLLGVGCHSNNNTYPGTPVLTMGSMMSSPNPEFSAYIIAIDAITLTDSNGNVVEPLSTPETVDLTKITDLSELVEAPAVPSATYVSVAITLDYTAASIWVIANGQEPVPATAVDSTGSVMSSDTVTITFDPHNPLVVTLGQSIRWNIDIDLAASNTILSISPAQVQVQPFVVASTAPADTTVMRARGLYVTTQSVPSGFIMNMRPFYDLVSELGALTVNTTAQTYFNVNGVAYTGAAGVTALGGLLESTPIVAYGTLDSLVGITPSFNATSIYAGSSQEGGVAEYMTGTVIARSGDTLDLHGVTYLDPEGVIQYYSDIPVGFGSETIVSEDGVAAANLSINSISVGQKINVSGQAGINSTTGTVLDLDATAGQVRLQQTQLWGALESGSSGSATVDMLTLDNWHQNALNFAGTATGGGAVNPGTYVVNTGAVNESGVTAGTLLQFNGLVTPFGTAPPDFTATTVTPGSATEQVLICEWTHGGSPTPFSSVSNAGLVVDLSNAALDDVRYIRTGPATLDLKTLPASPLITTVGAPASALQLAVGSFTATNGVSVYNNMADFISKVQATFPAGSTTNQIFRLTAYGQYNSTTNTFVATRIHVALQDVIA